MFRRWVTHQRLSMCVIAMACLVGVTSVLGQGTAFQYQGRLTDAGTPANTNYDMQFKLFDSADFVTGNQVGATITTLSVQVTNGVFTVQLDFGAGVFTGAARFLEIAIRPAGSLDAFTVLSPRQPFTSAPYAVRSITAAAADAATNATNATNAAQLGGIAASQYVLTSDARLSDARPPTAGSTNYIQNTASQQASANFNISGNGTLVGTLSANTINAVSQYNINGARVLSASGDNLLVGAGAGQANTIGATANSFFGSNAGLSNTTGVSNTIIGSSANVGSNNLSNATAIGTRAVVSQSNSLVLGSVNGVNGVTWNTNVGIGTTAPIASLHIATETTNVGDNTALLVATNIGPHASHIHFGGSGDWYIRSADGAGKVILQDTGGNVGVGTNSPSDKLHVSGDIRVGTGTTGCVKDANGTVIAGVCSSDLRLKKDILPFHGVLTRLVKLQPVHFRWRSQEHPQKALVDSLSFGLIAQDVEQVVPELVTEGEDGFKLVRYNKLPFLMLQAIKELKAENDALQKKNVALDSRISALERMIREHNVNKKRLSNSRVKR